MKENRILNWLRMFPLTLIALLTAVVINFSIDGMQRSQIRTMTKASFMCDSMLLRTIADLHLRVSRLEKQIDSDPIILHNITATMYYPLPGQTDDTPDITAAGYKIDVDNASDHNWIAISRDLLEYFSFGDTVYVVSEKKSGMYVVADLMAKRWRNKIDILETPGTPMYAYKDVKLIKMKDDA